MNTSRRRLSLSLPVSCVETDGVVVGRVAWSDDEV